MTKLKKDHAKSFEANLGNLTKSIALLSKNGKGSATTDSEMSLTETLPQEFSSKKTPDPTRYGDWERNGRCIDF